MPRKIHNWIRKIQGQYPSTLEIKLTETSYFWRVKTKEV